MSIEFGMGEKARRRERERKGNNVLSVHNIEVEILKKSGRVIKTIKFCMGEKA